MEVKVKEEKETELGPCSSRALTNDGQLSKIPSPGEEQTVGLTIRTHLDSEEQQRDVEEMKTAKSPSNMKSNLRFIKKERIDEDEKQLMGSSSQRSNPEDGDEGPYPQRSNPEDGNEDPYSLYGDEALHLRERFGDGEITVVQIPGSMDPNSSSQELSGKKRPRELSVEIEPYSYRVNCVPIVYPIQSHPIDYRSPSSNSSPSPKGYRLEENEGTSSPLQRRIYYEDQYWRSESSHDSFSTTCPSPVEYNGSLNKGLHKDDDKRDRGPSPNCAPMNNVPDRSKARKGSWYRKEVKPDRLTSREDDKEEESLWKQVQRYRHRKRPVLGKFPAPTQEETIFMQYNEIRERRHREGRLMPKSSRRVGSNDNEGNPPMSQPSGVAGELDKNVFVPNEESTCERPELQHSNAHVPEMVVTSFNQLVNGTGKDEAGDFCSHQSHPGRLNSNTASIDTPERSLENEKSYIPKLSSSHTRSAGSSPDCVLDRTHGARDPSETPPKFVNSCSPSFLEFPSEMRRHPQEEQHYNGTSKLDQRESRNTGMADCEGRFVHSEGGYHRTRCHGPGCGEYSERFMVDKGCLEFGGRRKAACHCHCCYSMEAKQKRRRGQSDEDDDFWSGPSQVGKQRKSDSGIDMSRDKMYGHAEGPSPTQNGVSSFSPASSDAETGFNEQELPRESRHGANGPVSENGSALEDVSDMPTDILCQNQIPYNEEITRELSEDDIVCQVNGLFSLPGYRETKYNISRGELKRRIGHPETLTRVEMISYVRQAKTSGRILLDKNGITTSNRSHPSILSRVCEREAQVLAYGIHKMNLEYLPMKKMVQKYIGMYKSRTCDGCQDCRSRLRRRIVDVEITRNVLKELLHVTQEARLDGVLDTFDLASHTFGTPNLTNNIKLIDEYFKLLLVALENE